METTVKHDKDAYERYLQDISRYPRITPAREAELSGIIMRSRSKARVEAAVEELVLANLKLVVHCMKDFEKFLSSPSVGITRMDLISEGNIGLMNAARRYNVGYGKDDGSRSKPVRFSVYACKCIKSQMRRALKLSRFIHIPEHHFGYWSEMESVRTEHGEKTSDELLRKKLNVSEEVLGLLKQSEHSHTVMLEDLSPETEDRGWNDFIADTEAMSPAEEAERHDMRRYLCRQMTSLPSRTRNIVSLMFLHEQSPSLRDVSKIYGVSGERCRQVCGQGLKRLRRQMAPNWHRIEPTLPPPAEIFAA
jgi:RNA polymerase primary sigma factor